MSATQKRIALVVAIIGLAYFTLFIFPNNLGAKTFDMLRMTSTDEPITYPYVVRMLQTPSSLKDLFVRWVVYGDYHYGWIFYLWSALVVLPTKLFYGMGFENHVQLNLLLMRQLVSVLPMTLAIIGLVYLQTRFKNWFQTLFLLISLLTIRSVFRLNIQFWHPDALSLLAVVITFFFLVRDRLRFGRNFYFAAAACGVAIGIKLAGAFFFLAIPAYLIAGYIEHAISLKRIFINAGLFVLIMAAALVITNPFLYNQGARADLVKIQTYKNEELSSAIGYPQDNSLYYNKGPYFWNWTLYTWFGSWEFLLFLFISLLAGCFWGPNKLLNRLILAYIVPYSIYLFYFVAPKPDTYMIPVMVPLFSSMLSLPEAIKEIVTTKIKWTPQRTKMTISALTIVVYLVLAGHIAINIDRFFSGNIARYEAGMTIEQTKP